jgi:hypothetical protein
MEPSPTERVRVACKAVVDRAIHVRIDHDRIPSYAASLPMERATLPALDPTSYYLGRDDDTVAFLLTLDATNFGSGYFPLLHKHPCMSGYITIAASLNDRYEERSPLPAQ